MDMSSELLALENLVMMMAMAMQIKDPRFGRGLRENADYLATLLHQVPVNAPTPEEADLWAAEFQEAWERLMKRVLVKYDLTSDRRTSKKPR